VNVKQRDIFRRYRRLIEKFIKALNDISQTECVFVDSVVLNETDIGENDEKILKNFKHVSIIR